VLSRAGLVAGRRAGQEVRYALVPEPLDEVSGWMRKSARSGTRLARLRQLVLESNQ